MCTFFIILNSESKSMINENNIDIGQFKHRLLFEHNKKKSKS